jgi:Protein of unknown function (DUF3703)
MGAGDIAMTRVGPMPDEIRERLDGSLGHCRAAIGEGRWDDAWPALETAHILSQPWWRPHVAVHWRMLRLGARCRDRREVLGQVVRLAVAGPGSISGRYPVGNTGRARVPAREVMPLAEDLDRLLAPFHPRSAER